MQQPEPGPKERFLRMPEVEQATGTRKSFIYAAARRGTFPQPVKLGRRMTVWIASEVDAWIAQRIAARQQGGAQ